MEIRDYNGEGKWSADSILERYRKYSNEMGGTLGELVPRVHAEGQVTWIYPVMDQVIEGIERGDKACVAIGIEFVEEDASFPFGRVLKSNTARALRRAKLSPEQVDRVRERVVHVMLGGRLGREFKEYSKLLGKIGMGSLWPTIEQGAD